MKKIFMTAALLSSLAVFPLYAQDEVAPLLSQGTKELALSGTIEFPEFEEVDFDIDASYGYFVRDGWELGVRALGADIGGVERFSFSGFTEYNFNRDSNIVPYLGASVGLADVNFENLEFDSTLRPNDGDSTVIGFQGGIKWFVRSYMAISMSISFNTSTEDIYLTDDNLKDNLTRFRIGLRYYF
ncbi:MAG: hypothetical protein KJN90_14475 [Gammaproteobacteria bacterium]|nr:hypothetical protein [Gammaproteobacteria bacterium]